MMAAWCLTAMLCLCGCGVKETSLYDRGLTDAGNGGGAPMRKTMTQSQTLLETLDVVARQDCSTPRQCIA